MTLDGLRGLIAVIEAYLADRCNEAGFSLAYDRAWKEVYGRENKEIHSDMRPISKRLLDHAITSEEYSAAYDKILRAHGHLGFSEELSTATDSLFTACDSFDPDCPPEEDQGWAIGRIALRRKAEECLAVMRRHVELNRPKT